MTEPAKQSRVRTSAARILLRSGDHVIIDRGALDGLRVGLSITFFSRSGTGPERAVALGEVSAVSPHRARVELRSEELVRSLSIDASAEVAPAKAEVAVNPRFTWSTSIIMRPFLDLQGNGGGLLADGSLLYRAARPLSLRISVSPFGVGERRGESVQSLSAFALAAYDSKAFELGAGLGVQTVLDTSGRHAPGTGTMLPIFVRVGELDDLSLSVRFDSALFYSQVQFTGLRGDLEWRVGNSLCLRLGGGGGPAGYAIAELGLRARLTPTDSASAVYVLGSLGATELWSTDAASYNGPSVGGPFVSVGFEYRVR